LNKVLNGIKLLVLLVVFRVKVMMIETFPKVLQ